MVTRLLLLILVVTSPVIARPLKKSGEGNNCSKRLRCFRKTCPEHEFNVSNNPYKLECKLKRSCNQDGYYLYIKGTSESDNVCRCDVFNNWITRTKNLDNPDHCINCSYGVNYNQSTKSYSCKSSPSTTVKNAAVTQGVTPTMKDLKSTSVLDSQQNCNNEWTAFSVSLVGIICTETVLLLIFCSRLITPCVRTFSKGLKKIYSKAYSEEKDEETKSLNGQSETRKKDSQSKIWKRKKDEKGKLSHTNPQPNATAPVTIYIDHSLSESQNASTIIRTDNATET